jgi:hypothetical protein
MTVKNPQEQQLGTLSMRFKASARLTAATTLFCQGTDLLFRFVS